MEDFPPQETYSQSQLTISPKVFILSLIGIAILSSGITYVFIAYSQKASMSLREESVVTIEGSVERENSEVPADPTIESKECGISFNYPNHWSIMENTEKENACYLQVGIQNEPLQSVTLMSAGEALDDWNDLTVMKAAYPQQDALLDGSVVIEAIPFFAGTAIRQTNYIVSGRTLDTPTRQLFFSKGRNMYEMNYLIRDDNYNSQVDDLISSIRFTQADAFYDVPLLNYWSASFTGVADKAQDAMVKYHVDTVFRALVMYYEDKYRYPLNLNELLEAGYVKEIPLDIEMRYITENGFFTLSALLSNDNEYTRSSVE